MELQSNEVTYLRGSRDLEKAQNQVVVMQNRLTEIKRAIERQRIINAELERQIEAKKKECRKAKDENNSRDRKTKEMEERALELANFCESISQSNLLMKDQLQNLKKSVSENEKKLQEKRTEWKGNIERCLRRYEISVDQLQELSAYPAYSHAKNEVTELEERLQCKMSFLKQRQGELFKLKCEKSRQKSGMAQYYPLSNFVINMAKQKCETMRYECEIQKICEEVQAMKVTKNAEKIIDVEEVMPLQGENINENVCVPSPAIRRRQVQAKWTIPKINIPKFSPRCSFKTDLKKPRTIPRIEPVRKAIALTSLIKSSAAQQKGIAIALPKLIEQKITQNPSKNRSEPLLEESNNAVEARNKRTSSISNRLVVSSPFFKNSILEDDKSTTVVRPNIEDVGQNSSSKQRKLNNVPPLSVDERMVQKISSQSFFTPEPTINETDVNPPTIDVDPVMAVDVDPVMVVDVDPVITANIEPLLSNLTVDIKGSQKNKSKPSSPYCTPEEKQPPNGSPTAEYLTPRSGDVTYAEVSTISQITNKTLSPLNIEKYKKEWYGSPDFKYETRRLYEQPLQDLPPLNVSKDKSIDVSINYDILHSPEPEDNAGTGKNMFALGNSDKTGCSMLDIFGNAGEESAAGSFTLNFGGASKAQTEAASSFFQFKF